jgi:hypothetical protein
MKNTLNTIMSILILAVLAAGVYFIVKTVRESAAAATAPLQQVNKANQALQTQVAQMMNPTPTIIVDPVTRINDIRALARLETIQYNMQQVVESEDKSGTFGFLFGTKYLVLIHGTVIAGIDMGKIQPSDMRLDGGVLYVKLPPAEVLVTTLDESKTEIYTVEQGLMAHPDPNLILDVLQAGKDKILSAALEDGILTQAQANADAYLLKFFTALGYQTVLFEH